MTRREEPRNIAICSGTIQTPPLDAAGIKRNKLKSTIQPKKMNGFNVSVFNYIGKYQDETKMCFK